MDCSRESYCHRDEEFFATVTFFFFYICSKQAKWQVLHKNIEVVVSFAIKSCHRKALFHVHLPIHFMSS